MALYLPVRAFNRSQSVRIGTQEILSTATTYVDVSNINIRKAVGYHSALGAIVPVGPLTASNETAHVRTGVNVTQGTTAADRSVRVLAGEFRNDSGVWVTVAQTDLTITPGHATLGRIDSIVVNKTTGVATVLEGTAATTPVAPTPLTTTFRVANITVVAVSGVGGTNEVQGLAVNATGGTYTLTYATQTTATINHNALAATVQSKLVALSNIDTGDVVVTGGPGDVGATTPYVLTFGGALAETDIALLTSDPALLTGVGTAVVSETTPGAPAGIADAAITDTRPRI